MAQSLAQKAIKDNLGILNDALNSPATLHVVAQECVAERLITPEEFTLIFDTLKNQPLQARVDEFVGKINTVFGKLPKCLDNFLCVIHGVDTLLTDAAAKNIAQSCKS